MKEGTRVKVTYTGTLVEEFRSPSGAIEYTISDSEGTTHWYHPEAVTIENVGPENWPPQKGDVWKAGIRSYFARKDSGGTISLFEAQVCDGAEEPDKVLRKYPDIKLAYRD